MSAPQSQAGHSGWNVTGMLVVMFLLQILVDNTIASSQPHTSLTTILQTTGGTEGSSLVPSRSLLTLGGHQDHQTIKRSPEAEPGTGGGGVVTFSVTASLDTLRQKLLWSLQNSNRHVT